MKRRGKMYVTATMRWLAAGSPIRTDDEIGIILDTHCAQCQFFQDGKCRHKGCACNSLPHTEEKQSFLRWLVNVGMLQMLRRATSKCPMRRWRNSA